jgi:hypothetical protein
MDDVILNSSVAMLWNLQALQTVRFNTLTRMGSQTGQIGLPYFNPSGYVEWRQIYFQFAGTNLGTLSVVIGEGVGDGPGLEQYDIFDVGQANVVTVLAGQDVRINCNTPHTCALAVNNATVSVAIENGQLTTLTGLQVDGGSTVTLGPGVTLTGTAISLNNATLSNYATSAPSSITAVASTLNQFAAGLTYAALTATDGTTVNWVASGTITTLTLARNSTFDKSQDWRALTITNSSADGTCQIIDPLNTITYTNATTVGSAVNTGLFQVGGGRTVKVT